MSILILALIIVALVLAGVDIIRSRAQSLTSWACLVLAVVLLVEKWPT